MEYPCETCLSKGLEKRSVLGCTDCHLSFCLDCGRSHNEHGAIADHHVILLALCKEMIKPKTKAVDSNVKIKSEEKGLSIKLDHSSQYAYGNELKKEVYVKQACVPGNEKEAGKTDPDKNWKEAAGNILTNDLNADTKNENTNKENCNKDLDSINLNTDGETRLSSRDYANTKMPTGKGDKIKAVSKEVEDMILDSDVSEAACPNYENLENNRQNENENNGFDTSDVNQLNLDGKSAEGMINMHSTMPTRARAPEDGNICLLKDKYTKSDNASDTRYKDLEFKSETEEPNLNNALIDTNYEFMENPIENHNEQTCDNTCWSSRHCDCYLHKVKFSTDIDKKLGGKEKNAQLSADSNETIHVYDYDYADNDEIEDLHFHNTQSPSSCCVYNETTETLLEGANRSNETPRPEISHKSMNNRLNGNNFYVPDRRERAEIFRPPDKDKERYWLPDKVVEQPLLPYKDKERNLLHEKDKEYLLHDKVKEQHWLPDKEEPLLLYKDKEQHYLPDKDKEQTLLPDKDKDEYCNHDKNKEQHRLPHRNTEQLRLRRNNKEQYRLPDKDNEQRRLLDNDRESGDRLPDNTFIVKVIQSPSEVGILSGKFYLQILQDGIKLLNKNKAHCFFWPFNGIRRFGKQDTSSCFIIEAGRRCESGPGEFVFKSEFQHKIYEKALEMSKNS